jgi:hypothetical protein
MRISPFHLIATGIFWMVNFERFHQDFRDMIMIDAIERKLDTNAGECFKYMLEIMYLKTHAWQVVISTTENNYFKILKSCLFCRTQI